MSSEPLRIDPTRRVVSIRCSRSLVPKPEQRLATERDGECLERIGRSAARRGCASEYGVRKLADQTHRGGCQGSIDGLARAGEWLPRSFFGQRATVSLRPSRKPLQGERKEEEMKWRAGGASIPTRNPHSPQPACHRSREGATSPDCPRDAATAHHSSAASRHSAGKSEYQQVRTRSMAGVADAGSVDRPPVALLRTNGTTEPCAAVGICFIEPPDT